MSETSPSDVVVKNDNNNNDATSTTKITPDPSNRKVKVHFVPVGSAPMMKKTKFQLAANQKFANVQSRLRTMLKLPTSESLFMYLSSAFCPGPDQLMGDLEEVFATRGELIVHYSIQEAWG